MSEHSTHLTGRIDGALRYGEPIPAHFELRTSSGIQSFAPHIFRNLGLLLKSLRENDPQGYIRAQLKHLEDMGASSELVQAILHTTVKVDLSIHFGAGNREMAMDIIRTLEELKRKGGEVSTYGEERVISAGAYIWMVGNRRFTLPGTIYFWHTRKPIPGYVSDADKAEDLQMMRGPFYGASEPLRTRFLQGIDQDENGCHEIDTRGEVLVRAGLAEYK